MIFLTLWYLSKTKTFLPGKEDNFIFIDSTMTNASSFDGHTMWYRNWLASTMVTSGGSGRRVCTQSLWARGTLLPFLKQPYSSMSDGGIGHSSYWKMGPSFICRCYPTISSLNKIFSRLKIFLSAIFTPFFVFHGTHKGYMESDGEGCPELCSHSLAYAHWFGDIHLGLRGPEYPIGYVVKVWRLIFQWVRHFRQCKWESKSVISIHLPSSSPLLPLLLVTCSAACSSSSSITLLDWGIRIDVCHGI